ncbi:MAG: DUF4197 domain-containing protein [Pedobacter sp.]|nr:MAG: DUF4197 domain-containing protein [Pedobacter sp.]
MKRTVSLLIALVTLGLFNGCDVQSQAQLGKILNQQGLGGNPTSSEIALGIKQALEVGTSIGADRLSAKDGFMGNLAIKILFPPEAQKVERSLRSIGLGSLADNVITSINRAAEAAAIEAKPIFISAIKQMTIADAANILFGQKDAATSYFKRVTTAQLTERFRPVISSSLNKVGATKYWGDVASKYNLIAKTPVDTDLAAYVTQKAIDGLFAEIAKEELNIRTNFSARSTTLLQKVFGYGERR